MTEDERPWLIRLKPNLERRELVYRFIRGFFRDEGFLEVETPVRVPGVAPELHIFPYRSEDWFLSTSPELHMKRLLAAGYEKLYQFSRCFRKGERGKLHNPEFTMLEWYRTGGDYRQMIRDTEQMVMSIVKGLKLNLVIEYRGRQIDLTPPWPLITVRDAYLKSAGWDPTTEYDPVRFDLDQVNKVVPAFASDRPTILLDYPARMAALSRLKPSDPTVAERAEVFIGGLELANAYSELNDVKEQERRFQAEIEQIEREQGWRPAMPQRFIKAIAHLPDCGGIALGVDRLVMLFCNAATIDEVSAFTVDTA